MFSIATKLQTFFQPKPVPQKNKGGSKNIFSINPIFSTQLYIFLVFSCAHYTNIFGRVPPQTFQTTKTTGLPKHFLWNAPPGPTAQQQLSFSSTLLV